MYSKFFKKFHLENCKNLANFIRSDLSGYPKPSIQNWKGVQSTIVLASLVVTDPIPHLNYPLSRPLPPSGPEDMRNDDIISVSNKIATRSCCNHYFHDKVLVGRVNSIGYGSDFCSSCTVGLKHDKIMSKMVRDKSSGIQTVFFHF